MEVGNWQSRKMGLHRLGHTCRVVLGKGYQIIWAAGCENSVKVEFYSYLLFLSLLSVKSLGTHSFFFFFLTTTL